MDELEDLLAQHASVTMNLGLKDHSVSRRDALMGQSLAEKDRAEARNLRGGATASRPASPGSATAAPRTTSPMRSSVGVVAGRRRTGGPTPRDL